MSRLAVFEFETHQIRVVGTADNPWWVASDVCEVLGIKDSNDVCEQLDADEKNRVLIPTLGGDQLLLCVNEYGLLRLIGLSNKPRAVVFQRWIYHEVLPTIFKTGTYSTGQSTTALESPTLEEVQAIFSNLKNLEAPDKLAELTAIAATIPHLAKVAEMAIAHLQRKQQPNSRKSRNASRQITAAQWQELCQKDSIAAWMNDCLIYDAYASTLVGNDKTDTSKLFGSYVTYCNSRGLTYKKTHFFSPHLIGIAICSLGWKIKKRRLTPGFVISGIRLRLDSDNVPSIEHTLIS